MDPGWETSVSVASMSVLFWHLAAISSYNYLWLFLNLNLVCLFDFQVGTIYGCTWGLLLTLFLGSHFEWCLGNCSFSNQTPFLASIQFIQLLLQLLQVNLNLFLGELFGLWVALSQVLSMLKVSENSISWKYPPCIADGIW